MNYIIFRMPNDKILYLQSQLRHFVLELKLLSGERKCCLMTIKIIRYTHNFHRFTMQWWIPCKLWQILGEVLKTEKVQYMLFCICNFRHCESFVFTHNTTRKSYIKITKHVCGLLWQAISSKSKCRIRKFNCAFHIFHIFAGTVLRTLVLLCITRKSQHYVCGDWMFTVRILQNILRLLRGPFY